MSLATTNGAGPQAEMSKADQEILEKVRRLGRVSALRVKEWKVELSGGRSATLCDPAQLTERQRRGFKETSVRVRKAQEAGGDHAALTVASDDQLIVTFLRSWTLDAPLPSATDTDSLLDLPGVDYDHLVWVCTDLLREAFVDFTPDTEPSSPFDASSA